MKRDRRKHGECHTLMLPLATAMLGLQSRSATLAMIRFRRKEYSCAKRPLAASRCIIYDYVGFAAALLK